MNQVSDKEVRTTRKPRARVGETERKPVGLRGAHKTATRKDFHRHWINDDGDRIQTLQEGGYTIVLGSDGKPKTRDAKRGIRQVLMEIPIELYNEDQEAKQQKSIEDSQERLRQRKGPGFYTPGKAPPSG